MFETEDSGATWVSKPPLVGAPALQTVCWLGDGSVVLAGGFRGRIWRSEDGGETWRKISSGTLADLRQIVFNADGRLGWISGDAVSAARTGRDETAPASPATILRSENGGRTWTAARIPAANISAINHVWFDPSGQYGWAGAIIGDKGRLLRSIDSGRNWELVESEFWPLRDLTLTGDGSKGWAIAADDVLITAHRVQPPVIRQFAITAPDYRLDLSAYDDDTPTGDVSGVIEIESGGIPVAQENRRREFVLSDADTVEWPKNAFVEGEKYKFRLRLSDGWNIVARDYESGPADTASKEIVTGARPEIGELQGVDLTGTKVLLDGRPMETAQVVTRGGNGSVALTPSPAVVHDLRDGFHVLAVVRGLAGCSAPSCFL